MKDLRPGMRVAEMQSDLWQAHPRLYSKAGVLRTWSAVQAIQDGEYSFAFVEEPDLPEPGKLSTRAEVDLTEEVERARTIYAEAAGVAHHAFTRAAAGKCIDVEPPRKAIEGISDSVSRNPDAMHCLARLTPLEGHLATHSVNVAVLCVVFGTFLGMDREDVLELGLAGMLHDVGKAKIPRHVLEKNTSLTKAEFAKVKEHCLHGMSILHDRKCVSKRLKQAVVEHHERYDGSGYPMGLSGSAISPFARYIALADAFDAMTSRRTYKEAILPSTALSFLYQQRGSQFAPADVEQFIKCIGVYPTGSVVRLSDGRTAVVYETNPDLPLSPIVNVVLDEGLQPLRPNVVNLAAEETPVEIVSSLCPDVMGLNLGRLLGGVFHC